MSGRHYHCYKEPKSQSEPLLIYYSFHLQGNEPLSVSVAQVCFTEPFQIPSILSSNVS